MSEPAFDTVYFAIPIALFAAMPCFMHLAARTPRYRPLRDADVTVNMNLLTLWQAFFRQRDDPLKRFHVELSLFGHTMFILFLLWAFGAPLVYVALR